MVRKEDMVVAESVVRVEVRVTDVPRVVTMIDDIVVGGEDMVWSHMKDGAEVVEVTLTNVLGLSVVKFPMPAEDSVIVLFHGISPEGVRVELGPVETIVSGIVLTRATVVEIDATILRCLSETVMAASPCVVLIGPVGPLKAKGNPLATEATNRNRRDEASRMVCKCWSEQLLRT